MNKWISEDCEFTICVTSEKAEHCRLGFETEDILPSKRPPAQICRRRRPPIRFDQSIFKISPKILRAQVSISCLVRAPFSMASSSLSGKPHPILTSFPAFVSL